MRGKFQKAAGITFLVSALVAPGSIDQAAAEVRVNINLGPPPIVVSEPPAVVMVPGSQVYFVPEVNYDVFYYSGYWWSPRGDRWYRATRYDGPWRVVERRYVPGVVYRVPKDYRKVYYRERHIPYGQWKKERSEHRPEGRHDRGDRGGRGDHGDRGDRGGRGDHGDRGDRGHGRGHDRN